MPSTRNIVKSFDSKLQRSYRRFFGAACIKFRINDWVFRQFTWRIILYLGQDYERWCIDWDYSKFPKYNSFSIWWASSCIKLLELILTYPLSSKRLTRINRSQFLTCEKFLGPSRLLTYWIWSRKLTTNYSFGWSTSCWNQPKIQTCCLK